MSETVKPRFKAGASSEGSDKMVPIWLIDDNDRLIHAKPICLVSAKYHYWFIRWIEEQDASFSFPVDLDDLLKKKEVTNE